MKIYFCGSIRGGRNDVALYQKIIQFLKDSGHTVLTEHIASPEVFGLEKDKSDHQIWSEDMAWLEEADMVIAECTTPSLGVGYELAMAKQLHKPTYVFSRQKDNITSGLSAMISGDQYFHVSFYNTEDMLFSSLMDLIAENGGKKC